MGSTVTDDRDTTPAEQLEHLTEHIHHQPGDCTPTRELRNMLNHAIDIAREALAEHQQMREELAELKTQHGATLYPGGPVYILEDDQLQPWRNAGHANLVRRLVGEWQPADDGDD